MLVTSLVPHSISCPNIISHVKFYLIVLKKSLAVSQFAQNSLIALKTCFRISCSGAACTIFLVIFFFSLWCWITCVLLPLSSCFLVYFLVLVEHILWTSLVAQMVKNLPAMQETWVQSLGQEAPLQTGMATHSSILAWKIPWTEEPGRLQSMGLQRAGHDWATSTHTHILW